MENQLPIGQIRFDQGSQGFLLT